MFNSLSTSTEVEQSTVNINSLDSKRGKEREQLKSSKSTKLKCINTKEFEENQKQRQQSLSKVTVEKQSDEKDIQNETDTNTTVE